MGTVVLKEGVILSASDALEVVFHGKGAHGSAPSSSIDPIVMGAHFVSDVQSVVSRQKDAGTFGVITVGAFQSGTVGNIIPDEARLRLSLRSFTPEVRKLLMNGVEKTAQAASMMAGAPEPTITRVNGAAATVNDAALGYPAHAVAENRIWSGPAFHPSKCARLFGKRGFFGVRRAWHPVRLSDGRWRRAGEAGRI